MNRPPLLGVPLVLVLAACSSAVTTEDPTGPGNRSGASATSAATMPGTNASGSSLVTSAESFSAPTSSTSGGGSSGDGACATLSACCATLAADGVDAQTVAQCETVVKTGDSLCATTLAQIQAQGYCGLSSSTSAPPSLSAGSSATTASSESTASSTTTPVAGSCATPPTTLPVGFTPPTGVILGGCTAQQVQEEAACLTSNTDAGVNACDDLPFVGAPDGAVNSCGACLGDDTFIPVTGNAPAQWGLNFGVILTSAVGDTNPADLQAVTVGYNPGACIWAADPTNATVRKCALDQMALEDCVFSICLPLCPVDLTGADGDIDAQINALYGCENATVMGACAGYNTAANTDCAALSNTDMTGVVNRCGNLENQDENTPEDEMSNGGMPLADAGTATLASEETLLGLVCGGYDAGAAAP